MHKETVRKKLETYTVDELKAWREHVLFCLDYFEQAKNDFEVSECRTLLRLIDERLRELAVEKRT
ncbi:hypothetical protein ACFPTR_08470 [Aliibacillus thermotolerans]|uniref:Uncharacterized protein n=1 Tax=Aliibacillus thermotolerans TaxID=1834418 RepID=A0ABW0U617_9BACI|nr:hypothetical protein [Aliibacillus thermotolerans]MDA3129362.1 hypothetical protein [Aliibacillus thermotolerans]